MPTNKLVDVIKQIKVSNPNMERVSLYGNVKDILRKKEAELNALAEAGLSLVYIGFESGDDITLSRIKKGANKEQTIESMIKLKNAGIKVSGMVLLGVGGKDRSIIHAYETADMLTKGDPDYVGLLSLQLRPDAPIYSLWKKGDFELPDKFQLLKELEIIAENTELSNGYFFSNHISNYLPIKAIYPKDKAEIVQKIKKIILEKSEEDLRPEYYRDIVNQY
tara:strand:- start:132 stop:794 length:663 start_codon:yes stop_codon:yes gene_type:complete